MSYWPGKGAVALDPSSQRLRDKLMRTISSVGRKYHTTKGRRKQEFKEGTTQLLVFEGDMKNVKKLEEALAEKEKSKT